jgi:ferredoxin
VEGGSPPTALRITIDPDLCIGSGDCVRLAPHAFRIDEGRGISTPLPAAATADREILEEAAFNCPTNAIAVVEDEP